MVDSTEFLKLLNEYDGDEDCLLKILQTSLGLISEKRFNILIDTFDQVDVSRLNPDALAMLIRTTANYRANMEDAWWSLLERSKIEMDTRGIDNESLWVCLPKSREEK